MALSKIGGIESKRFGFLETGEPVDLFMLSNTKGMEVTVSNYGGIITSILVPDRNGALQNVVLGFDHLEGYKGWHPYFGTTIGRYGNRIIGAHFALNGDSYHLSKNDGDNNLHGGINGFDKKLWKVSEFSSYSKKGIILSYLSKDGEEGFPGNLSCQIKYSLTEENEFKIEYSATTNKTTVVNLTNHSYFNLRDGGQCSILDHELMIKSSSITIIDDMKVPTGAVSQVSNSPFDFRELKPIREVFNVDKDQLAATQGYDHNFVLDKKNAGLEKVAVLSDPVSGRSMEVITTEPGLQLYIGNNLEDPPDHLEKVPVGRDNIQYKNYSGLCLETQHFPDSPNQPGFPSVVLNPGEKYNSTTIYKFSVTVS